jgi:hypothetical protein
MQEVPHLLDHVAVALPSGKRRLDVLRALRGELRGRHPVPFAVVALAQPLVEFDWDVRALEGDSRGLHHSLEVRHEGGVDAVVAPALAQRAGLAPTFLGQLTGQPARRDTSFVVRRG